MSTRLASLPRSRIGSNLTKPFVRYQTIPGKKDGGGSDPRLDIIRQTLYPSNIRNRPSPTGTWRPDVAKRLQRAIPSVQTHETIERAWLLHKRHIRRGRQGELERKFRCMEEAMETLHRVAPDLWKEANKSEDPNGRSEKEQEIAKSLRGPERKAFESRIRGLFPRELRIPTDTPPTSGWKYDYTPLVRPS